MSFWGVEVKPGKPVSHSSAKETGRLRISQATLGFGTASTKTFVQCNVGNKSPVLLCVLMPDKTESCHLDLEFEETVDVVFSVVGPRSVFLTGYYVSRSQHPYANSDSESYGEDIQNTETEGSSHHSDDDEYEDSFIDDGELEISPRSSDGGTEVKRREKEQAKVHKSRPKRLKKKYQVIESESSDDEDGYLLSVFKSKRAAKTKVPDNDSIHGGGPEETVDGTYVNGEKESVKQKRKRKDLSKVEQTLEVENGKDNGNRKDMAQKTGFIFDNRKNDLTENGPKLKKGRKELQLEDSVEGNAENCNDIPKGEKYRKNLVKTEDASKNQLATNGEHHKPSDNKAIDINSNAADGNQTQKKGKKKKKKNRTLEEKLKMGEPKLSEIENKSMRRDDHSADAKPALSRTLSNGLVIEEVAMGEPKGKMAAPGKKVKVNYIGMLKESGQVFDSHIGKVPFKFQLGDQKLAEGWNMGIDGMCVGDKRRLVIPPSMSSGNPGAGENIPPNSWLVYDVELVSVRG